MINLRLPVIVCGKSVTRLQNKTILRACEIRSQCVSFVPPISLKLSLALHSVLHGFENFSGFNGFFSTPNGQNLTRL